MLSSGQVIEKYNIHKNKLDTITRKFRKRWNLKKDGGGRYIWDKEALKNLESYLGREAAKSAATVADAKLDASAEIADTKAVVSQESVVAATKLIAEKISQLIEVQKKESEALQFEIKHLKESHSEQIESLKQHHHTELNDLSNQIKSLKFRLGNTQAQFEKRNQIFEDRLERRTQPATFLGRVYKFFFQTPVLLVDRRKK